MKIEIVAIGNEILSGHTINSNSAFIANKLAEKGYDIHRQSVFPDDEKELEKGLKDSLENSDIVICTGGLGPTFDDITKKVVAKIYNLNSDDQEMEKKGVLTLKNEVGTAPGFIFKNHSTLIVLPGVPLEMKNMFEKQVLLYLEKNFPCAESYSDHINLCMISETKVDPVIKKFLNKNKDVQVGIYPKFGTLQIRFSVKEKKEKLDELKNILIREFRDNIFPSKNGSLAEAIHEALIKENKTLIVSESCTGGAIATQFTSLSGSSNYFLGSMVTYSNLMKTTVLNVSSKTLKDKGAVSKEVAIQMAEGAKKISSADYSISTTGIAGPSGGSKEKPVGTVWVGVSSDKSSDAYLFHFKKDRLANIEFSVNYALSILWQEINK
jgi:nicotinamide-nucleotide amidase